MHTYVHKCILTVLEFLHSFICTHVYAHTCMQLYIQTLYVRCLLMNYGNESDDNLGVGFVVDQRVAVA